MPTRSRFGQQADRRLRRGFTLIEVVVVVIIIAVLAVLAIPSITERMRDRRTQQAAHEVVSLYRNARLRAMGRGAAVLVRFFRTGASTQGRIEVWEAIQGASASGADCAPLPGGSCLDWDAGESRRITLFDPNIRAEYAGVQLQADGPPADQDQMDICFTPLGSTFVRFSFDAENPADSAPFTRLAGVPSIGVRRVLDGDQIGIARTVIIPPNGASRLAL